MKRTRAIETTPSLPNDVLIEVMTYFKYNELVDFCLVNQQTVALCQSDELWQRLMARHFPWYHLDPDEPDKNLRDDYLWHNGFFDRYVFKIIGQFKVNSHNTIDINHVYDKLFSILTWWMDQQIDMYYKRDYTLENDVNKRAFHDIMTILKIPHDEITDKMVTSSGAVRLYPKTQKDIIIKIRHILNGMFNEYIED